MPGQEGFERQRELVTNGLPFCGQIQYLVDKREKIGNTKRGLAT